MSSSLKGCTFTRWSRSYSQSSITSTMKCFNSYKHENNQSNSPCKRRFVCPPYLLVVQVYHVFTSSKQCEDTYLSIQVLPNFWILFEKLFPNHFYSHLPCTVLQSVCWGGRGVERRGEGKRESGLSFTKAGDPPAYRVPPEVHLPKRSLPDPATKVPHIALAVSQILRTDLFKIGQFRPSGHGERE